MLGQTRLDDGSAETLADMSSKTSRLKSRFTSTYLPIAVVLCADILGYSGLIGTDEEGTQAALTIWRDFVDRRIEA